MQGKVGHAGGDPSDRVSYKGIVSCRGRGMKCHESKYITQKKVHHTQKRVMQGKVYHAEQQRIEACKREIGKRQDKTRKHYQRWEDKGGGRTGEKK